MPVTTEAEPEDIDDDAPSRVRSIWLQYALTALILGFLVCSPHHRWPRNQPASGPSFPCPSQTHLGVLPVPGSFSQAWRHACPGSLR
jgi:hypothetical protein